MVRDPRRLGPDRVRVQIVLGDLADPFSFRSALRGVDTVVHLAATIRDQPGASIEELAAVATWRLVQAAERAGVERFVFFSTLGASTRSPARLLRAKAIAERAVISSSVPHTVFAPSMVYAPGDPFLRLLERLSLLPVVPLSGAGRVQVQPIWAEDVVSCVMAALPSGSHGAQAQNARFELAGPETLTYRQVVQLVLRSLSRRRAVVGIPTSLTHRALRWLELVMGPTAPVTWDEAELLEVPLVAREGPADAQRLGISPAPMAQVLGRR
jgi:NADH dehydrogenase